MHAHPVNTTCIIAVRILAFLSYLAPTILTPPAQYLPITQTFSQGVARVDQGIHIWNLIHTLQLAS